MQAPSEAHLYAAKPHSCRLRCWLMLLGHWFPCSTFGLSLQWSISGLSLQWSISGLSPQCSTSGLSPQCTSSSLGIQPHVLKLCTAGIPPLMGLIADLSETHLRGGESGVLRAALELLAALLGGAGPQVSLGQAPTHQSVLATPAAVRSLAAQTPCAAELIRQAGHPASSCPHA